jgi:hypothetical protein
MKMNMHGKEVLPGGFYYSSIIRNKKDFNLVLRPDFAKKQFSLNIVSTIKIIAIEPNKIIYKKVRDGWPIKFLLDAGKSDSTIFWTQQFTEEFIHDVKF